METPSQQSSQDWLEAVTRPPYTGPWHKTDVEDFVQQYYPRIYPNLWKLWDVWFRTWKPPKRQHIIAHFNQFLQDHATV